MHTDVVTPAELKQLAEQGKNIRLIDVRTPVEFRSAHISFAQNVPLDTLDPATLGLAGDQPLFVVCQAGGRSKQACDKLRRAGLKNVVDVSGGTQACIAAGLPVSRGKASISLERQVRIAAGSLVLLGVALGFFAHPGFFGLSAFVGAGLVFAGVTDTCGMGLLLARAPWNRG